MTTKEEIEELINAQIKLVSSDDFLNPLVEQRFDEFDQDKSGYLDKEEFWDYLQELRDDMEAIEGHHEGTCRRTIRHV